TVNSLTTHDNELVAGGTFTYAGGSIANRIAHWNGSGWQPFGSGVSSQVNALAVYNGEPIAGCTGAGTIWHWDGTTWQPVGSGLNNSVFAMTVYNSDLIAGGAFLSRI